MAYQRWDLSPKGLSKSPLVPVGVVPGMIRSCCLTLWRRGTILTRTSWGRVCWGGGGGGVQCRGVLNTLVYSPCSVLYKVWCAFPHLMTAVCRLEETQVLVSHCGTFFLTASFFHLLPLLLWTSGMKKRLVQQFSACPLPINIYRQLLQESSHIFPPLTDQDTSL